MSEQTFSITVQTSASEWPESGSGVRPVLSAVQKMLLAAARGNKADFQLAQAEMENAGCVWQNDLFGDSDDH